jgi:hypothetical protein
MNNTDPAQVTVFFILCPERSERRDCHEAYLIHSGWRSAKEWEEAREWFVKSWVSAFSDLEEYVKLE